MINKEKNNLIQITLSNTDTEKLLMIQESLSKLLAVDLTKSQAIAFLIRNYDSKPKTEQPKPNKPKSAVNYQAQISALKDKLNVSFTELSAILSIPASTLKKYASGTQEPKKENAEIILNALKRYGIK